jgi:hypothetical protein
MESLAHLAINNLTMETITAPFADSLSIASNLFYQENLASLT